MEEIQNRITTGLRVNGPKDDAATFAIAQNMRGDIAGMNALKTTLGLGQSTVNVAIDAGKAISNLLTEMKAKSVQASQAGMGSDSYSALQNEFRALRAQLTTIAETAEFNGKNLITAGATDLQVLSIIEGSTITVAAQSLDPTTLLIHTATLATANSASQARVLIDSAITTVANSLASLGSAAKRVDIQASFTSKLMDIVKQGVGNLVDAVSAEESANLQVIQIK